MAQRTRFHENGVYHPSENFNTKREDGFFDISKSLRTRNE